MNQDTAHVLYEKNWAKEFTTIEDLHQRIEVLAQNGAYELCVYIDSKIKYDEVVSLLRSDGFVLEDYNGGNNNILRVTW